MNLYLKQKVLSIRDKFTVYDQNESPIYSVEGKLISAHQKHYIYNNEGEEVAYIYKKFLSLMPKFFVERPIGQTHEVKGKLAFAHEKMVIEDLGWVLVGKFLEHDYTITKDNVEIASVHQKWLSWGDTYEISVAEGIDEVMVLSIILCIDIMHEEDAAVDSAGTATAINSSRNN